MRLPEISKTIQVPDGVDINIAERKVTVTGTKGTLIRDFSHAAISLECENRLVRIWAKWPRKKETALIGTIRSHILNMITGVEKGFSYKLKIVFAHFPMSVKDQGKFVIIENFTGERNIRKAKKIGDVKVTVQGEDITIEGLNLENVSQTAANIEQATKVKNKDCRVFLDGVYVFERNEGMT
jgi:large subunit ribosomal protein L6